MYVFNSSSKKRSRSAQVVLDYEALAASCPLWIDPTSYAACANNAIMSSPTPPIVNRGSAGSSYNAVATTGAPAYKTTYNSFSTMRFSDFVPVYRSMELNSNVDMSTNGTMLAVGYTVGTRLIVLGGKDTRTFLGWGAANGTSMLFRNTGDGGLTIPTLTAVVGFKVLALIKNGNSVQYFDNNTHPVSVTAAAGTYVFRRIGSRGPSS